MNQKQFGIAIDLIRKSEYLVALTGAGVSVESGIPAFRGERGLWATFDPEIYASISGFFTNPGRSWEFFIQFLDTLVDAKPNAAHKALALMESRGKLHSLITQNIDGLHTAAGQDHVIEIHGNMKNLICMDCARTFSTTGMILDSDDLPPRCSCGGILKPDAVLFGEPIPHELYFAALEQIRLADVLILAGTSGLVHPVNEFPEIAVRHGAKLIEINQDRTPLTSVWNTVFLEGSTGEIFSRIVSDLSNGM